VNRAIEALRERKHRARPRKNATASTAPDPARRKRTMTVARRKLQAERMKAYWAARRKAEAKAAGGPKAA
jgi:hypothetical protein